MVFDIKSQLFDHEYPGKTTPYFNKNTAMYNCVLFAKGK